MLTFTFTDTTRVRRYVGNERRTTWARCNSQMPTHTHGRKQANARKREDDRRTEWKSKTTKIPRNYATARLCVNKLNTNSCAHVCECGSTIFTNSHHCTTTTPHTTSTLIADRRTCVILVLFVARVWVYGVFFCRFSAPFYSFHIHSIVRRFVAHTNLVTICLYFRTAAHITVGHQWVREIVCGSGLISNIFSFFSKFFN